MADWASCAAALMETSNSDWMVMDVEPSAPIEGICEMSAIWGDFF